ncbi:MAG: DUF4358 domain-containing protein [Oscillospiraceae bacterium]|nr:DUF4358 domain-containing protein [Oscillospiraceae bacterium]
MNKRLLALILSLFLSLALLISGCGGSREYDVAAIAEGLLKEVSFSGELSPAEGDALANLYALNDSVAEYAIYYDASAFSAQEVAVLKADSASDAEALREILETRIENLRFMFENYNPGEMQKLESPVIDVRDNIAVMVISDDPEAADKAAALLAG